MTTHTGYPGIVDDELLPLVEPLDYEEAVDTFCGAGGASAGLAAAGLRVIGFDHWDQAIRTHNLNGHRAHVWDLSSAPPPIKRCSILWGSPPCQPYSSAGDGEGDDDQRDGIPWWLDCVRQMRPHVAIMENVKGLTFAKFKHVLE